MRIRNPVCMILGGDGLDSDVVKNLEYLYRSLGYSVVKMVKNIPEDFSGLLVISRSNMLSNKALENCKVKTVIIYDYVGDSINNFDYLSFLSQQIDSVIIYSTSYERMAQLRDLVDSRECATDISINFSLLPVFPKIWIAKKRHSRISRPIHIGHFKSGEPREMDPIKENFLGFLKRENAIIGGRDWPETFSRGILLGEINLRTVSALYAKCEIAVGLMYPFQRQHTYSGRYWHAPLNGCTVLSEETRYSAIIPGVISCDLSKSLSEIRENCNLSPDKLMLESSTFWKNSTNFHIRDLRKKIEFHLFWSLVNLTVFLIREKCGSISWISRNRRILMKLDSL